VHAEVTIAPSRQSGEVIGSRRSPAVQRSFGSRFEFDVDLFHDHRFDASFPGSGAFRRLSVSKIAALITPQAVPHDPDDDHRVTSTPRTVRRFVRIKEVVRVLWWSVMG
jgi:hypothetical protein